MGLPGAETINALRTDTFTLLTYTVPEDSLRTDELSTIPLGYISNDPIFGSSSSNFYTQFLLLTDNFSFGNSVKFDSVVLSMAYTGGYYGDINSTQKFTVKELSDDLAYNSDYFSNTNFQSQNNIGQWEGIHAPKDSVLYKGSKVVPHMRIRLDANFGKNIIANGKTWLDNPDFLSTFKGLAILSEKTNNTGCQVYFDPTSPFSAVTVYYNDSMSQPFSLYTNGARSSARISTFNHLPTNLISGKLANIYNADTCYIQSQASTKMKIEIPHLKNILNSNPGAAIVVHGAELTITPLAGTSTTDFPFPTKLLLVKSDSVGHNSPILDLYLSSFPSTYIGGVYDAGKNTYTFNFLNEMQEVFKNYASGKNINYGYYVLIPGDNPVSASRVIIDSRKSQNQIKFKLTYSVVK